VETLPTQDIGLDSGTYFLSFSHNSYKIHRKLWTTVIASYSCYVKVICCTSEKPNPGVRYRC